MDEQTLNQDECISDPLTAPLIVTLDRRCPTHKQAIPCGSLSLLPCSSRHWIPDSML